MGFVKLLTGAAKSVTLKTSIASVVTKNAATKTIDAVVTKSTSTIPDTLPDILQCLNKNAKYHSYSPQTKKCVQNFREFILKSAKQKNDVNIFKNNNDYVKNLVNYCEDEKAVSKILANVKNYNLYTKEKSQIFKTLKNMTFTNVEDVNSILTNLTVMKLTNQKNFRNLMNSKGMKEIIAGNLNIEYIKNLKSTDNIDYNYFYNLFENIENATNKRLIKSGLDKNIVNKYLKLFDEEICMDSKFIDNFVSSLEKIKNPQLANDILNKFPIDDSFKEFGNKDFLKIIDLAAEKPEIVTKALKIKKATSFSTVKNIKLLSNNNNQKIDKLFNYYLNFENNNPDLCAPLTFDCMVSFFNKIGDEALLKEICEKTAKCQNPNILFDIFTHTSENNIDILKSMLKNGIFDNETLFKFKINSTISADKTLVDKVYKKTYLPLKESLDKYNNLNPSDNSYIAEAIAKMQIENPKDFEYLQNTKILDLIKQGKINTNIIEMYEPGQKFTSEILSDVQKLINNESLIKKFDTAKDVLKNTNTGDVISIKNKLYINNNGHLEPWNISEEKFNELFPLVDRFTTIQGKNDCYFISPLTAMYKNPKTRGNYYKMFEQKGNDIYVTIPAYKDFLGEVKFPNGQIETSFINSKAAKNVQMLEQTYARTALRNGTKYTFTENPLTIDNLEYLQQRIDGGFTQNVLKEILPNQNVAIKKIIDKNQIEQTLKDFANNKKTIIQESFKTNRNTGHARTVTAYNPYIKTVTVIDPHYTAVEENIPLDEFLENIYNIIIAKFS